MDWLQSSQICQQVLGDRGGTNLRKGYKVGDLSRNHDPDKSDTPLLHDNPMTPERENAEEDWTKCKIKAAPGEYDDLEGEKQGLSPPNNGFSSSKVTKAISKVKGNSKIGSAHVATHSSRSPLVSHGRKPSESEKPLIDFGDQTKSGDNWSAEEDDDDSWSMPRIGRYQKVLSSTD